MAGKKTAKKTTAKKSTSAEPAPTSAEPASASKTSTKKASKKAAKKSSKKTGRKSASARKVEAQIGLDAITIEGGLLSPSWLSRIAQTSAPSQAESDYAVPKGLTLRDEIARYWRIARAHWSEFEQGRTSPPAAPSGPMPGLFDRIPDEAALARRFVLSLLEQCFGFSSIRPVDPPVIDERIYPIGHSALGGRVPIVIAPAGLGLDTPDLAFGEDKRRRSPFGLAQEYLNAEAAALWGLVSDGLTLRVLRDNASLTRPAWIEADLARIFTEDRHAEFAALWLLIHASRFGRPEQPVTECALETWRNAGIEEGTRARDFLRSGVEDALAVLGQGFLAHPDNRELRAAIQDGRLATRDYFNQLLRLVYRVIFLLTIEERGLLHAPGSDEQARKHYAEGYGLKRLRDRAVRRNAHDRFSDVWESVKIVFRGLAKGEPRLALPALAGLFAAKQCEHLDAAKLENHVFMGAMFLLSWLRENGALARVNWRDMGPEELGSVYESLLELVPRISKEGREFGWAHSAESKGNARKTSGSYYTPDSLVKVLLDHALEPVVTDTLARNPTRPIEALLELSIVDPACGSGHFLLGAARRLAGHVARLQANGTPSLADYRHAVRQVVGRCIYGVDLNPLAVELCKVSLWMEAVDPGLPLTFLDSHVQQGNSLLGTTPELMTSGIPDSAFEPIEGDDRKIAAALKTRNQRATSAQQTFDILLDASVARDGQIAEAVDNLDRTPDILVSEIESKEALWQELRQSPDYQQGKLLADLWCAAFVWPKLPGPLADAVAPTNDLWTRAQTQSQLPSTTAAKVAELSELYGFFHWHLQFPNIFRQGGFSVVLGNPPWERVKLHEQEFFSSRRPDIAGAKNASIRKRHIQDLAEADPELWEEWLSACRKSDAESHFIRRSGRFPLCARRDINTYSLFAEHNISIMGPSGRAGFIVPTGIATDDSTKFYFQKIVDDDILRSLFDFQSGPGLFGEVGHGTFKFALVVLSARKEGAPAVFSFFNRSTNEAESEDKVFSLRPDEIHLLNPNTRTCPTFRTRRDAMLTLDIYRRIPTFCPDSDSGDEAGGAWRVRFLRMIDMTNDASLFMSKSSESALPLIEAKMINHYDHRFGDYADHPEGSESLILPSVPVERLADPMYEPSPRHWVGAAECHRRTDDLHKAKWMLGWRDVSKSQNERTLISAIIPYCAVANNMPLMFFEIEPVLIACLYANLCSFILDYVARQKIGGTHMNYFVIRQLPVLPPPTYTSHATWLDRTFAEWVCPRVVELMYTSWSLEFFAHDLGYACPPFVWMTERRSLMMSELDALFFHLYGVRRPDIDTAMDSFHIVRKNDEKAYGEYRTKRLILEIYDEMAEAIRTGKPYQTRLDPPPADPSLTHPPRETAPKPKKPR